MQHETQVKLLIELYVMTILTIRNILKKIDLCDIIIQDNILCVYEYKKWMLYDRQYNETTLHMTKMTTRLIFIGHHTVFIKSPYHMVIFFIFVHI